MHRFFSTLPILAALIAPGVAAAASTSSAHIGNARFDLHADLGGYASVGAGFRVDIPLIRTGLLANADDELALSPGLDVYFANVYHNYYDSDPYVIPSAVLQWNFYFPSGWSVFPEAGIAFYVGDGHYLRRGNGRNVYATADFGLGARYHFSARNALLLRISTPTGFQIGVTF